MRKHEMTGAAPAAPEGWSVERVAALTQLWTEGWSASQIAGKLGGVTRNGVIGKVHRLELPARRTTQRAAPAPRRLRKAAGGRKVHPWRTQPPVPPSPPAAPRLRPLPQIEVEPCRIALLDLRKGQCRWPIGDPQDADFAFCGHTAGRTYCEAHHSAAHSR